ncbi:MAG: Vgb family protein [Gaiellaceae bacterium]
MRLVLVLTVAAGVLAGTVSASATPQPVARVVTGAGPCGAASGFGSVWVAVYGTGRLVRIDPRSNRVVARIGVARGICPIVVAAGSVWVASDMTIFGGNPSGLAEAGGALWIAFGRNGSSLGRLDPKTGTLTKSPIGHNGPGFLSAIAGSLWTTTADGFAVRFDPSAKQVVGAYAVPGTPAEAAAGPDGMVWVAEKQHNTLTRIDPDRNRIVDVTGAGPGALAITGAGGDMWVTSFAGRDIWRFRD